MDAIVSTTVGSGLTVLHEHRPGAGVVAIQAWIAAGAADERPDELGVAHFFEHMVFKGGGPTTNGVGLATSIESVGGDINAWTSLDHTVFHAVLPSACFEAGLTSMANALVAPRWHGTDVDRERAVILEEIRHHADDPLRAATQGLYSTAFVAHSYRRPVIGSSASVARLRASHLEDFAARWYTSSNLTLVIAGDVEPATALRVSSEQFAPMRSNHARTPRARVHEPAQLVPRVRCANAATKDAHVAIGFMIPALDRDRDFGSSRANLELAAAVLGQGDGSRLVRRLRDEQGLVADVDAQLHRHRDAAMLVVNATATPGQAAAAALAIAREVASLGDDLSDDELAHARVVVASNRVFQHETVQGSARRLGQHHAFAGNWRAEPAEAEHVNRVRRGELATALSAQLVQSRTSVAIHTPGSDAAMNRMMSTVAARLVRAPRRGPSSPRRAKRVASIEPTHGAVVSQEHVVRTVLHNGLTLLVKSDPSMPVVAMRATWLGGTRLEKSATNGMTSLLAGVLVRGCAKRDAHAVGEFVEHLGGSLSSIGGRNSLSLRAEWLAPTWSQGFDLLADCVTEPRFDKNEIEQQKHAQLDALEHEADYPTQVAFRLFAEALFRRHPYRLNPNGDAKTVAAMTRAAVARFYREHYPAAGLTIAVVGDVDPDEVLARVRARFNDAPAQSRPASDVPVEEFDGRDATAREVYRYLPRNQAYVVIGFPGTSATASDRFAIELLTSILGGQSGRLFSELRDKQGLAYQVAMYGVDGIDPGYLAIYVACAPERIDRVVQAIHAQIDALLEDGISAEELARAQRFRIGTHAVALQRRAAVANALAYHEAYGLGWQEWARYPERINAVTVEDLRAASERYLRWDRAITATVRPPAQTPEAERRTKNAKPKTKGR